MTSASGRGRWRVCGLAACLTLAGVPAADAAPRLDAPGGGSVWALVIGADTYQADEFPNLLGARADALDIADRLGKAGLDRDHLTSLIEGDVTGKAVRDRMKRLVADARKGDLVIVTYAGHGAQEPEAVKGSEKDGLDELYVLPGFDPHNPQSEEFILDDEVNGFVKQLDDNGVDVIVVADSCFGGGMARLPDPRIGALTFRGGVELPASRQPPNHRPETAFLDVSDFKHVVFLSAVSEATKAPEVPIDIDGVATMRGAMSYAFARAVAGSASELTKGLATRSDLFASVRQVVYQYSAGRQRMVAEPSGDTATGLNDVVFRFTAKSGPTPTADHSATVRLKIVNGTEPSGKVAAKALYQVVGSDETADLVWDATGHDVVSSTGDVIAHGIGELQLAGVIDRTAVVAAINKLAEAGPQTFFLLPDDRLHHDGDCITFRATGLAGKFPILFDVNGNGTIDYVFPKLNRQNGRPDDDPQVEDDPKDLSLTVGKPFGADFIVALVFDERHAALEAAIAALDEKPAQGEEKKPRAGELLPILTALAAERAELRVGAVGSFSDPAPSEGGKSCS